MADSKINLFSLMPQLTRNKIVVDLRLSYIFELKIMILSKSMNPNSFFTNFMHDMEFTIFSLCIAFALLFVFFYPLITVKLKQKIYPNPHLPPGNLGWPVIGETLGFIRAGFEGKPERFIRERMEKYDSRVFKTCLLGEDMIVFCGTAGHKLLFSNENKLVRTWWPSSVGKLFKTCLLMKAGDDAKRMRRMMMMSFLSPNALMKYVERIDMITQQHIATYWEGRHTHM